MIDDHLSRPSCSIHGSSRVNESLRARTSQNPSDAASEAVAMLSNNPLTPQKAGNGAHGRAELYS
jgi:hypothetical protein